MEKTKRNRLSLLLALLAALTVFFCMFAVNASAADDSTLLPNEYRHEGEYVLLDVRHASPREDNSNLPVHISTDWESPKTADTEQAQPDPQNQDSQNIADPNTASVGDPDSSTHDEFTLGLNEPVPAIIAGAAALPLVGAAALPAALLPVAAVPAVVVAQSLPLAAAVKAAPLVVSAMTLPAAAAIQTLPLLAIVKAFPIAAAIKAAPLVAAAKALPLVTLAKALPIAAAIKAAPLVIAAKALPLVILAITLPVHHFVDKLDNTFKLISALSFAGLAKLHIQKDIIMKLAAMKAVGDIAKKAMFADAFGDLVKAFAAKSVFDLAVLRGMKAVNDTLKFAGTLALTSSLTHAIVDFIRNKFYQHTIFNLAIAGLVTMGTNIVTRIFGAVVSAFDLSRTLLDGLVNPFTTMASVFDKAVKFIIVNAFIDFQDMVRSVILITIDILLPTYVLGTEGFSVLWESILFQISLWVAEREFTKAEKAIAAIIISTQRYIPLALYLPARQFDRALDIIR
ncbi:MAG: hypothetical protein PUC71_06720 [Oscillospiraceae bacterium]|nr:hypothetical protein [Oscillospiraceae bacterium]